MDRLETMRVFTAVAEEGGFAPAARKLGLSPPAVTRGVAALEHRIGTRLFHRTTRIVRLTETGARYLADCKRILAEIDEAEAIAAGDHAEPRGQLAVTASVLFGRMYVAPVLFDFLAAHPHVGIRTLLLDRIVDLIEEGMDVGIRIAHLPDSSLSAIRVGAVRRVVCASPDFLDACGRPGHPADLAGLSTIAFAPGSVRQDWSFRAGGKVVKIAPAAQLVVNTAEVAIAGAIAGRGLTRVLSYMVGPDVKAGRLEIVLPEFELPPLPIQVVHAEGRWASARVRAFIDFAVERLRATIPAP